MSTSSSLMSGALPNVLGAIGSTPIVRLNRVASDVPATIYVKCEQLSPSGSAKDRMALHLIDEAEKRGVLTAGGTIVAATTGSAGAALAMIAAVRGYKCVAVMPDAVSQEKVASLRAWGAKVHLCPSAVDADDPRSYQHVAKKLASETAGAFFADQHHSQDNPLGHERTTGPEIWAETKGELDVLCVGLATGGTATGAGRFLKSKKPGLKVIGVDPVGSVHYDAIKSGRATKAFTRKVEGIGASFTPSTLDASVLDDVIRVDDRECFLMARELVRLEGLYVGGAGGAAVAGAIKYARETQRAENILVIVPDSADKYLSRIFDDGWMRENGFLENTGLGTVADLLKSKSEEIITASAHDRVRDVIARMKAHGISQLPVVDGTKLVGAVAEVDMLRYLVSGEHSLDSPVGALVENDYATVSTRTSIESLQALLAEARMAIVVEGERIVGVATKIDLIDYLARRAS